jgi:hypothetical protein
VFFSCVKEEITHFLKERERDHNTTLCISVEAGNKNSILSKLQAENNAVENIHLYLLVVFTCGVTNHVRKAPV